MSPLNNLSEMSLSFTTIHIRAIKDMVHEVITLFQEIWQQIDGEQGEASLMDIRKHFQLHEDIDMGWINMC
jgi:hypothetical protein